MKNAFRKGLQILHLVVSLILFSTIMATAKMEVKHVLILHSYHRGLGWTDSIAKGIDYTLANSDYQIETFTEYMDTKRIFNEKYLGDLAALFKYKYRNRPFDVIISSDDHAFQFLLKHHDNIFPNTPVVFCGVNYFKDEYISSTPYFTGVVEAFSIKDTVDAALTINPNLRQIYSIVDKTVTGTANLKLLESITPVFENRLEFITITDKDMTEVTKEVRQLPPESVVLLLAFTSDRSGNTFSLEQSADLITAASNRPVYSFWDFHLNHGILGGMLTTGLSQGVAASELALRIIGGEDPSNIKVVKKSPNRYIFDYKILDKFGIPLKHLPPNYNLINHPTSFYEQDKLLIWSAGIVFCFLLLAFLGVAFGLVRSRKAEEALKEKTNFLDQIIETSALSMWISDKTGTAIRTNPACLEFFGASEEEVVGKYNLFKDVVIEKKGFMPVVKDVFEKGKPANIIIDYDFGDVDHVDVKNATHKIIQTVLTPVLDNNKLVSNVIVQAIDITEIKKSEEEKIQVNKIL
ncbi:PAS domain S-box protein, partial [bacterium]|nr:PAS domain S-box protein [bacterium]